MEQAPQDHTVTLLMEVRRQLLAIDARLASLTSTSKTIKNLVYKIEQTLELIYHIKVRH